jgi:hypothetical protein
MSQWDTIKTIKDTMNVRQVAQDTADFIIMDLESEGYKARLDKNGSKNPKKWKIVPDKEYTKEQIKEFERIKNEKRELYFRRTKDQINQMKESLGLKIKKKNKHIGKQLLK